MSTHTHTHTHTQSRAACTRTCAKQGALLPRIDKLNVKFCGNGLELLKMRSVGITVGVRDHGLGQC